MTGQPKETHEVCGCSIETIRVQDDNDPDRVANWDMFDALPEAELDELERETVMRVGDDRDGLHAVLGVRMVTDQEGEMVLATGYDGDFDALGCRYDDLPRLYLDTRLIIGNARYLAHDRSRYQARGNPIDDAIAASRCPDCDYNVVAYAKSEQEKRNSTPRKRHHGRTTERRMLWHGKDCRDWHVMVVHAQGCPRWEGDQIESPIVDLPTGPQWVSHLSAKPRMFDGLGQTWDDPIGHVHRSGV
jgi:hypothetical protein